MKDITGLIHLSRKAGKLLIGQKAVIDRIKRNNGVLVLVASDAGNALKRKLMGIEFKILSYTSDKLGELFNRDRVSILAVDDPDFAKEISSRLNGSGKTAISGKA